MRNRAKCKKCQQIIESFHSTDFVICGCNEIAVDGGEALKCFARDWTNFLRVDDEGNEIVPEIKEANMPSHTTLVEDISTKDGDALEALKAMIDSYVKLPRHVIDSPATSGDLCNVMMIIYQAMRDRK